MSTPPIPIDGAGLTSAWLSETMGTSVDIEAVEPLGRATGLLASLWRVWCAPPTGEPSTVVVKLPGGDAANRAVAQRFGYYRREATFYRHLAPELDGAEVVARSRGVALDPDGLAAVVLEDLGHLDHGDQLVGADLDTARRALQSIAVVHARWWGRADSSGADLPGPHHADVAEFGEIGRLTWPYVADRVRHLVDTAAVERALTAFESALDASPTPRTVVHGDFRLDNIALDPDGGGAVVLDWQLAQFGLGAVDVARFLSGSMDPRLRRGRAVELVTHYHRALCDAGVTGLTVERCATDVRLGLVLNLPNPISAAAAVSVADGRGARLLRAMLERSVVALVEVDAELAHLDGSPLV